MKQKQNPVVLYPQFDSVNRKMLLFINYMNRLQPIQKPWHPTKIVRCHALTKSNVQNNCRSAFNWVVTLIIQNQTGGSWLGKTSDCRDIHLQIVILTFKTITLLVMVSLIYLSVIIMKIMMIMCHTGEKKQYWCSPSWLRKKCFSHLLSRQISYCLMSISVIVIKSKP